MLLLIEDIALVMPTKCFSEISAKKIPFLFAEKRHVVFL